MPTPNLVPPHNLLLAALSGPERRRLLAHQDPVELVLSDTLVQPGERIRHVFFPIDSFVSLITAGDGASQLEVGLVGNEGMVGVSLVLGVNVAPLRALVQGAGTAWRVDAATFRRELKLTPKLQSVLDLYVYVQMNQLAQTAACTRFHVVEARLARWLLMTRDRSHSSEFRITHELLARMLGVRRVGVTRAASALQRRGLIAYKRGNLQISNERGLEAAACSCYATDIETYERVLG